MIENGGETGAVRRQDRGGGREDRDDARRLGMACGLVVSAVALTGYVFLPASEGGSWNLLEVGLQTATEFASIDPGRHAAVLVAPAFVLAFGATLLARRRGLSGRSVDASIVGGTVIGPLLTAVLAYGVLTVSAGVSFGLEEASSYDPVAPVALPILYTGLGLIVAIPFLVAVLAIAATLGGAGALGGYLAARGVYRASGSHAGDRPD